MKKLYIFLLPFALSLSNCATIIHGSKQQMIVTCEPRVASVFINGLAVGKTPLITKLNRKDRHLIKVELEGYEPYEVHIDRKLDGWILGNILFGGLIGVAVDIATGGMYRLSPKDIFPELTQKNSSSVKSADVISVVVVLKPKPEWEKIGQLTTCKR